MIVMTRREWRRIARAAAAIANQQSRIHAIKFLRVETGCGLIEAFHAIDRLMMVNWRRV